MNAGTRPVGERSEPARVSGWSAANSPAADASQLAQAGPIVLFDGVCNLCNRSVQFLIDHDSRGRIRFASLQSPVGQQLLERFGLDRNKFRSLVLIEGDRHFLRSTAALRLTRYLDGLWRFGYFFLLVPAFLRDLCYDLVASNRYRWFGQSEACRLITPELRQRFLDG